MFIKKRYIHLQQGLDFRALLIPTKLPTFYTEISCSQALLPKVSILILKTGQTQKKVGAQLKAMHGNIKLKVWC